MLKILMTFLISFLFSFNTASANTASFNFFLNTHQEEKIAHPSHNLQNSYYKNHTPSPAALVHLTGMGETAMKYHEYSVDVAERGVQAYFWDHIGHGTSSHLIPNERDKVHIDDFETYIETLIHFLEKLRSKHKTIYVSAHSMGGHIALRVALQRPELIDKLVVTAPMIELHGALGWLDNFSLLLHLFSDTAYPPFAANYEKGDNHFERLTHSKERADQFQWIQENYPEVRRHTVTMGWLKQAVPSMKRIRRPPRNSLKVPTLLITASADKIVDVAAQARFCNKQSLCSQKILEGARHEILAETDNYRSQALDWIFEHFQISIQITEPGVPPIVAPKSDESS